MNSQRSEIKACVCHWLDELVDEPFIATRFSRRKDSLAYSRKVGKATQKIGIMIEHHPKDAPDSAAAVYPQLEVRMNSVNSLVLEMVRGDHELLAGDPSITLQQPAAFTSGNKGLGARWFIYQPDSVSGAIAEMNLFLQHWTIPFLDCYATPADICGAYERGDKRVMRTLAYPLRVVAAMLLCGRDSDAMAVMEHHFGKLGPRRRYQRVFEYLEARNR